jgi:hypothetical protein
MKTSRASIIGISTLLLAATVWSAEVKADADQNATAKQVPLASFFNNAGITKDGAAITGGLDDQGNACSATLLGASQTGGGIKFQIGSGVSNVVMAAGQTVPLPAGKFSSLHLLMTAVNGNQETQNFLVNYDDGTVQTNAQSVSDWFTPSDFPSESQAVSMAYRNTSDGSKDEEQCYVYGYSFNLSATNTVKSVTLPTNNNLKIFALTLVP